MLKPRDLKIGALRLLRAGGGFRACEMLANGALPILCYHGIAVCDEDRFRPKLFMTAASFAARMDWLAAQGYKALALGEALDLLNRDKLPPRTVVITFDDGWYGCLDHAFAKLSRMGWPATLYATTYYAVNPVPVFNIAVSYLLWKAPNLSFALTDVDSTLEGQATLADSAQRTAIAHKITAFGERNLALRQRVDLLYRLATRLGLDPVDLFERRRAMTLMRPAELQQAASAGVDIQLHTHRHRLPVDDDAALIRELADNRAVLSASGAGELVHFCYPGGFYRESVFQVLRDAGVQTATTTKAGMNYRGAELLALTRFLDGENVSTLEFEAELKGVTELVRRLRMGRRPTAREPEPRPTTPR